MNSSVLVARFTMIIRWGTATNTIAAMHDPISLV